MSLQQQTPVPPVQPQPFDMAAVLQAFAQMAQQQGQTRLQMQEQQLGAMDPLGSTARANSRPGGFTPQSTWEQMFPSRPSGAGYAGGMGYKPSPMSFGDAAVGASQPQPNAAMLRSMPAQNPFIGQPDLVNPPRALPVPGQPLRRNAGTFGATAYRPPFSAFGAGYR